MTAGSVVVIAAGRGPKKRAEAGQLLNLPVKAYNRAVKVNVKL
jgi:hypothetical protein